MHGVAILDSPIGPFVTTDNFVFDIILEDERIASAEDPFVRHHSTQKKFYVVFKDFLGKITEGKPGLAMLESVNGIDWLKPDEPIFMRKEVVLNNGETIHMNRLECPKLLIDEFGNPKVLNAAGPIVNVNPRTDGNSFNVCIPLAVR